MKRFSLVKHFNWKIMLLRIVVNGLAIFATALILPNIYFVQFSFLNVLIVAIALGILNAIIKPILLFLTAQLFFATFGILVILINTVIIYLIGFIFPNIFSVDGIGWALVGGALLGLIGNSLENLLGLTPPIIPDEERGLRQQIAEQSASPIQQLMRQPDPIPSEVDTQSIEEITAARTVLDVINASAGPPALTTETSFETENTSEDVIPVKPVDQGGES